MNVLQNLENINEIESTKGIINKIILSFHPSFCPVSEKLQKWQTRFPLSIDNSVFDDLALLFLKAPKEFLNHRTPLHLFRLILAIYLMQKKVLRSATLSPHLRHLQIRWIPTHLLFPFSLKPVMGCLIGFNVLDRYEMFDEENVVLALQKHLPQAQLVRESSYCHTSQHKNFKLFYFEIEQKNGSLFSLHEQKLLKNNLEEKVKTSIQTLSPTIFMKFNNEEIYKNVLALSQEIQTPNDLPQAYITLDQQTGKEIVFRVILVCVPPKTSFSLKDRFFNFTFVSERTLTIKHLKDRPVQGYIFRLHMPREPALLRSNGSLDFYSARQKVVSLITNAIGEFRDYNGGILIKQQEILDNFKRNFSELSNNDPEFMELFFYTLTPVEKQVILPSNTLTALFRYFLENRKEKLLKDQIYSFKVYHEEEKTFLVVRSEDSSLAEVISSFLEKQSFTHLNIVHNTINTVDEVFFNAVFFQANAQEMKSFVKDLREALHQWHQKINDRQFLRIALEYSVVSLDPRIGGEAVSGVILKMLFEGLMRFDQYGKLENGIAESIDISPDLKRYVFKLRPSFWNEGSPVSAYDFEYAWKKILSPDFKTAFSGLFYCIKNSKKAKEGKVPLEEIGIKALDDHTLVVDLAHPTSYFLQLTALPIYSPVHRLIDQQHPQWPYESEKNYPCNGPFQLKFNQSNQGYQLIKNPFYWDANKIALDQITLILMNQAQAITAFQRNEIDWIGNPFGGWHSSYCPRKDDRIISPPDASWVCWFVFNTTARPFHHCKLRQAFGHAIQRASLVEKDHLNNFLPLTPAYSPLLEGSLSSSRPQFPEYHANMARRLFKEALQELGLSKKNFPVFNLMFHENGEQQYIALRIKEQFKECLGIECNLCPLSWKTLFERLVEGDFQASLLLWTSWLDDPIYTLSSFNAAHHGFSKWESQKFQELLDLSNHEIDAAKRSSHLLKAEEILSQEMPIIPLYYKSHQALVNQDLHIECKSPALPFRTIDIARSFFNHTKETKMTAILKTLIEYNINQEIQLHPAWLGAVSGLKAEKMLRGKNKPYLYVLRTGESETENTTDYYVTYIGSDLSIRHQPVIITTTMEGWYYENGGGMGPFSNDVSINDVLHHIMHCEKGECSPLINFEKK